MKYYEATILSTMSVVWKYYELKKNVFLGYEENVRVLLGYCEGNFRVICGYYVGTVRILLESYEGTMKKLLGFN
jgi:hypothetical protein